MIDMDEWFIWKGYERKENRVKKNLKNSNGRNSGKGDRNGAAEMVLVTSTEVNSFSEMGL